MFFAAILVLWEGQKGPGTLMLSCDLIGYNAIIKYSCVSANNVVFQCRLRLVRCYFVIFTAQEIKLNTKGSQMKEINTFYSTWNEVKEKRTFQIDWSFGVRVCLPILYPNDYCI